MKIITQLSKQGYVPSKSTRGDEHQVEIASAKNAIPHTHIPTSKSNISNHQNLYGTINIGLRVRHGILVLMFRHPESSISNHRKYKG
jgi:hypothetical protein